eukprot:6693246-Pyramimonas_sp.AAC.1
MALKPDGFLWAAPPCSSWAWIAQGATGRSSRNPMGKKTEKVRQANEQASRCVLLLLVGMLLHNIRFMAEQPVSSLMSKHHRWVQFFEGLQGRLHEVNVWMQPFGADTPKRTWLASNCLDVHKLALPWDRSREASTVQTTHTSISSVSGKAQVTGTSALKKTQAYPAEFGKAVALAYHGH